MVRRVDALTNGDGSGGQEKVMFANGVFKGEAVLVKCMSKVTQGPMFSVNFTDKGVMMLTGAVLSIAFPFGSTEMLVSIT